ncbi:uncharacterized protein L3040_001144 [Drepanopeziza brunnea f. sp. 'multigermtubi']|uniref:Peroxisomal membrane protein PEX16 n=1 Tax=Marssonina brunnea f. sp. multigermtubi (strain MB_m1) TaxID=1072389 RepID=K1X866_MARBU|nr:peroxisomal membrane protein pex16 [Drepanopeziza brunnea f. sp. 'multigermtubi' MB_m1]EKD16863.1 peroxisomal membrane protein pex16 [Drepanopeziza brunnea f. sp. 'multigermtubi' MB_m1]KAJ5054882.1 hypothetical protein L3040_001144 [Drepanopeziza brunnea f. sp. 'multigermtubi']
METLKAAAHNHLPPLSAAPSPRQLLSLYSTFILKNQSSVTQIESALRSLTYIIPGRFRDAELASESLHSSIQLLSLYHDALLMRAATNTHVNTKPLSAGDSGSSSSSRTITQPQSPHARYTKFWVGSSRFYRRVATVLAVVQYTQLLCEMAAKRKGERARWRVVVLLELFKAACRLCLLRITNSRPLVTPPLPEREVIVPEAEEKEVDGAAAAEAEATFEDEGLGRRPSPVREKKEYRMKRTGLSLPVLPNPGDISSYLLSKVLTADDIKAPSALLNKTVGSAQLAEWLHILQPVVYAVAMSRSKNKTNWQPWLLGLSIEYAARQLRKDGLRTTALEREQWGKRGWAMGWWAMRGAFYENVTKGFLHGASEKLPSLVSGVLDDYLYLWDGYYFSTSSE